MNDEELSWLKVIFSYIMNQIEPQKSIPLDHLKSLNITDLDAITEDMFEEIVYTKDDLQAMRKALNDIIIKFEQR
jgi:hypothetical protein